MNQDYSKFGEKFTRYSGITRLMDDLGRANHSNDENIIMLGGGNPALIPQAHEVFVNELKLLIDNKEIDQMLSHYDGPKGSEVFIQALVEMFNTNYGWRLDEGNIAITNGSQASFFTLFNLFAGEMPDGSYKKVLLPIAPEYIGYADQGLSEGMFVSVKPEIHELDNQQFKYQIDFDKLTQTLKQENIGVICISRPTNPTGNVITDDELDKLDQIAQENNIPLVVDNAYGNPFPGVIYTDATLSWNDNTVLCMSLSKLGLPGIRTGIVIANHETIEAMSRVSGILTLAPNSVGPTLVTRLVQNQEILHLANNVVKAFYQDKAETAKAIFYEIFGGTGAKLHKLEGAFFMWIWFPDLKITSEELYQQLKAKDVYIIPGHNFFIGMDDNWTHQHQCIRINYAKDEVTLRKGLELIYNEIFL
ncbi:MAG: valine--pyruvate transaminase [Candidatus Ruthia sp.]|nr:valine--pyruvate transaminase [Candidatus Ruthturnera sp.]MBT6922058.1 valine--pyruvate transaminase [Candidatus Ruthturnera sp.]